MEEEEFHPTNSIVTSCDSYNTPLEKESKLPHYSSGYSTFSVSSLKQGATGGSSRTASSSQSVEPSSMLSVMSIEQEIDKIMGLIPGVRLDQVLLVHSFIH